MFRPYGLRVYLAARFSSPVLLDGLPTADPLDPAVRAWWKAKVDQIYRVIPDFGGFLVKANSEGQPVRRTSAALTRTAPTCWRKRSPHTVVS